MTDENLQSTETQVWTRATGKPQVFAGKMKHVPG